MTKVIDDKRLPKLEEGQAMHLLFRATNARDANLMLNQSLNTIKSDETTIIEIAPTDSDSIGIDQLRSINKVTNLKQTGSWLVVKIESAHLMTDEAQNYLLKSLEDSFDNQLYILSSDYSDRLLPTIVSRTNTLHYKPPTDRNMNQKESGYYRASGLSVSALEAHKEDQSELDLARKWLTSTADERLLLVASTKTKSEALGLVASLRVLYYGMVINFAKTGAKEKLINPIRAIDMLSETEDRLLKNGNVRLNLAQLCLTLR